MNKTRSADPAPDPGTPWSEGAGPWLRLLGGFELRDGHAHSQPLPYEKVSMLLSLLVLHSGAWERESLAALLWPDSEIMQARANLRRALFDLREVLARLAPDAELHSDKRRIELGDCGTLRIDTREFALAQLDAAAGSTDCQIAALRRARALYRGPLLAQTRLETSPAIAAWLQPRREALHRQAQRCLDQLTDLLEQRGEIDAAREIAFELLSLDSWDEATLRRCMRLLAVQRRDEALRLYQDFCVRLDEELHLQPQPATQALAAQLREAPGAARPALTTLRRRRVVALVAEWRAGEAMEDPDLLDEALRQVLQQAAQRLAAAAGWVQRAEGGELLAYFGHPEAREHAARHALDAALELLLRCAPAPLTLHIGLHVGWVHARAEPGSPDTLGDLSREARRLAWQSEAGRAHASQALRLIGQGHHRFGAPAPDGSAPLLCALPPHRHALQQARHPMVGRDAELSLLRQAWADARAGLVAVWIRADPGMGKTRLMQALRAELQQLDTPPALTLLHCLPEFSHSPLHPVLTGLLQTLSRLDPQDTAGALAGLAARTGLPLRRLEALKPLLWPEQDDGLREPLQRGELQALLSDLFDAWGGSRPQLLMIEDLHWSDPSTLELLGSHLQRDGSPRTPALLVVSSREQPPLSLAPHLRLLELPALPDAPLLQLIGQLQLPARPDLPRWQSLLLERAQGVPLFAQELARSMQAGPEERVPAKLWDLLAARLDRLPAALRHLAQCAAVLGSDWDTALLQATLAEPPGPRLELDLARLQAEGLLQSRADGRWQFRHALQGEAAYESLSPSDRRRLHRRAADALLGPLSVRAADDPARLAQHLSACMDPVAAHYWLQAGRRAAAQSAHHEACHAFRQGLAMLALPDAEASLRQRLEVPLLLQLGFSLLALEGYGSREARRLFQQAGDARHAGADASLRFQALWGLWLGSRSGPGERPALQLAADLLSLAEQAQDEAAQVQARYALGNNHVFAGQLQEALRELRLAAEAGERLPGPLLSARFGEHGGIAARAMLCWPLSWLGQRDEALSSLQTALRQARQLEHRQTLCYVLAVGAVMHRHWRAPAAAQALGLELAALAGEHGMTLWQAVAAMVLGWVQAWQGEPAGIAPILQAVEASAVAMPSTEATFLSFLSEAQLRLGQAAAALPRLDEAIAKARERQEPYLLPELWRMRAEALQALGEDAELIQQHREQARASAQAMQARLWLQRIDGELRSA